MFPLWKRKLAQYIFMTGEWIFWRHLQKGKSLEKTTWTLNSVPYKVPCKNKKKRKNYKEKLQGPGWLIAFLHFPWSLSSQLLCSLPLQKALLVFQQLYRHYHFCLCLLRDWWGKKELHTGSSQFSCNGGTVKVEGEEDREERQPVFRIRAKAKETLHWALEWLIPFLLC